MKRRQRKKALEQQLLAHKTPTPYSPTSSSSYLAHASRASHPSHATQPPQQHEEEEMDALSHLQAMFPQLDTSMLEAAYIAHECDMPSTVQYLLDQQHAHAAFARALAPPAALALAGLDRLTILPSDLFVPLCSFLSVFELFHLSLCNRQLKSEIHSCYHTHVHYLNFGSAAFRAWRDKPGCDDKFIHIIQLFPNLKQLNFSNCSYFRSFDLLPYACMSLPLEQLSFANCDMITDHHVHDIMIMGGKRNNNTTPTSTTSPPDLSHLTELDLSGCNNITDEALEHICQSRKNHLLKRIQLNNTPHVTIHGVQRLLEKCPALECLDMRHSWIRHMPTFDSQDQHLSTLHLSNAHRFQAHINITSSFCTLRHINLCNNKSLLDITLDIPTLRICNLGNCRNLRSLVLHSPQLQTLNLNLCLYLARVDVYAPLINGELKTELHVLNANGCRTLSTDSLQRIIRSTRHIPRQTFRQLILKGCIGLTDALVMDIINTDHCVRTRHAADHSVGTAVQAYAAFPYSIEELDINGCKLTSPAVCQRAMDWLHDIQCQRIAYHAHLRAHHLPHGLHEMAMEDAVESLDEDDE